MTAHRFVDWIVKQHGKDDTPVGDLAREFAGSFPNSGDRARLRTSLEYYVGSESWPLDAFDAAWADYENSDGAK